MKQIVPSQEGRSAWLGLIERKIGLYGILQGVGWIGYWLGMVLAWLPWLSLGEAVVQKGVGAGVGFLASLPLRRICGGLRRRWERGESAWKLVALGLPQVWGLALVWTLTTNLAFVWWKEKPMAGIAWYQYVGGASTQLIVLVAWVALYFAIRHTLELQGQRESRLKAEALAREAELTALRYQIHPHFLFNTLNTIATLVMEKDQERSYQMILNLSDFLRATLDGKTQAEVELSVELELTRKYLSIEAERLGDRLEVEWMVDEAALGYAVPALVLQPLVENAIRHAIARSTRGGKLWIRAAVSQGRLRLTVEDWCRDRDQRASPGSGIGLENTRKRLEHLYGGEAELRMTTLENGTSVEVWIPEKEGVAC
jgi:two-component sensor histidine kinase